MDLPSVKDMLQSTVSDQQDQLSQLGELTNIQKFSYILDEYKHILEYDLKNLDYTKKYISNDSVQFEDLLSDPYMKAFMKYVFNHISERSTTYKFKSELESLLN
jgi:uncharacterized protein YjgD (DUF1641 family)